jgi:hypothetical protein
VLFSIYTSVYNLRDSDYKSILDGALAKLTVAMRQKSEAEVEISKLRHFIHATMDMLSDEERAFFRVELEQFDFDEEKRSIGLKQAITRILVAQPKEWFTVTQVRDRLLESGFDFRHYIANPLSSVSTTLKRMKPEMVETTTIDHVTAYRWLQSQTKRKRRASFDVPNSFGG